MGCEAGRGKGSGGPGERIGAATLPGRERRSGGPGEQTIVRSGSSRSSGSSATPRPYLPPSHRAGDGRERERERERKRPADAAAPPCRCCRAAAPPRRSCPVRPAPPRWQAPPAVGQCQRPRCCDVSVTRRPPGPAHRRKGRGVPRGKACRGERRAEGRGRQRREAGRGEPGRTAGARPRAGLIASTTAAVTTVAVSPHGVGVSPCPAGPCSADDRRPRPAAPLVLVLGLVLSRQPLPPSPLLPSPRTGLGSP